MKLRTWKTGFGLWFCHLTTGGRTYEGGGFSEHAAIYRARLKARLRLK